MFNLVTFPARAPFVGISQQKRSRSGRFVCQDGVKDQQQPGPAINEDLIARLKVAEEEAQRLKKELAKVQTVDASAAPAAAPERASRRIDGGDLRRETLSFVESRPRNWLNESDVDFFTGGGPSEAAGADQTSQEEGAEVQRRVLLGLALTAAVGAFALVPTEKLQAPPSKPLFFYLVPLVRVQGLLGEAEKIIPEGDYEQLRALLDRIEGQPNNIQENLRSAAASLSGSRTAETADYVARDVYEYVKGIDYQTYFDSMGGMKGNRGGSAQKDLFEYSLQSAVAAGMKLKEFMALMPADQLDAARQQAAALPF